MNVLNVFEQRIGAIFGDANDNNATTPFSFKKLAKRAVREMEDETFVIEGVDTAPALYTVLVSSADDQRMRTLYPQITDEVSALVEAQAKKRGYTFVGRPLVRFMVDPGLKPGKFAVFAENVDPKTLARLRDEENAFLGRQPVQAQGVRPVPGARVSQAAPTMQPVQPMQPVAASVQPVPQQPTAQPQPAYAQPVVASPVSGDSGMDGLDVIPNEVLEDIAEENYEKGQAQANAAYAPAQQPEAVSAPQAAEPQQEDSPTVVASEPVADAARPATCTLTDMQSGHTYVATAPRTAIGRERTPGGIVLHDPNVSRHHAMLTYDNGEWVINDLNSTNGTLVNDIDVEACSLRDGDVITIGLINLQFKGN
ncbi:MAG: DUF3662 domain-containing protein [Coriobacteriales bacterium]|nr:DUF3662 domain-containing protein [Coriobacteriales bacterium]